MKKKIVFLMTILALLLSACGSKTPETPEPVATVDADAILAEGHVFPEKSVYLSFTVRGRVEDILVEEGDVVEKGEVLVRLGDSEQAEASLRAAKLALTQAQQDYDDFVRTGGLALADAWQAYMNAQAQRAAAERAWEALDVDALQDKIDDAEAEVRDRKEDLDDAQETFDKYKDLDEDNESRKKAKEDLDDAQEDYNEAVRKLEAARRDLDEPRAALDAAKAAEAEAKRKYEAMADEGLDPDTKALLDARLANAKAQVAAAQDLLDSYELKAPFRGTVTDINVKEGQVAGPEMWAVQMADFSGWYVETSDLTELDVINVFVGQQVTLVPDALPDLALSGTVERISESFTSQAGDILYTVKIRLNETDSRLRWGMTVEVTFEP
jgi:multidrug resistance efflux pump